MISNLCDHPFCISLPWYQISGETKELKVCRSHTLWALEKVGLPAHIKAPE